MEYKIAIASSTGKVSDLAFGEADVFYIYEVNNEGEYHLSEIRHYREDNLVLTKKTDDDTIRKCGTRQGNCENHSMEKEKIRLLEDCRCIICKKLGTYVQKVFIRKAITVIDEELDIAFALNKVISYFKRIDKKYNTR